MNEQQIFLITPLGDETSSERRHADRMLNYVFKPTLSELKKDGINCRFTRLDLLPEGRDSRVKGIMDLIRDSRGCIVDLYQIDNLNVIYEIGLAHSQGKRVYFLRSDKITNDELPSDIRWRTDYYHSYNVEIFESESSSDEIGKICDKVYDVAKVMITNSSGNTAYRPPFYQPTEQFFSDVLEGINAKISNLENLFKDFGTSSEDDRTLAHYITGEDKAFKALTEAIQNSNISVKTTRFSSYSVIGRQNTFFNAINTLMTKNVHPDSFERIIAANNKEKFEEIMNLMVSNKGKKVKIYISKIEYGFELVVIDDEIVFIHFRKYQNDSDIIPPDDTLITATLKIEKRLIAYEFSTIFDSIVHNSKNIISEIDCSEITSENISKMIEKYKKIFYSAVEEYEEYEEAERR